MQNMQEEKERLEETVEKMLTRVLGEGAGLAVCRPAGSWWRGRKGIHGAGTFVGVQGQVQTRHISIHHPRGWLHVWGRRALGGGAHVSA